MDSRLKNNTFKPGKWVWDNVLDRLVYQRDEHKGQKRKSLSKKPCPPLGPKYIINHEGIFRDDITPLEQLHFQRYYRRKCKRNEKEYVLLQDIKDVVLFSINPSDLNDVFIEFIHTPTVDRLFRALIIYFQFFFKVWGVLRDRRNEQENKIFHPCLLEVENNLKDDLSDLRAMVAREYCNIITGEEEMYKFHHMSNKNLYSFTRKDIYLHEMLIRFSSHFVWVALLRPNLYLIDMEMNRLMRSDYISRKMLETKESHLVQCFENEHTILRTNTMGECKNCERCRTCYNCKQSPCYNELFLVPRDPCMLAIGLRDFEIKDERIEYMEKLYLLPEEKLQENNICIGILGMPRTEFDCMLKYKPNTAPLTSDKDIFKPPTFFLELPPKKRRGEKLTLPKFYPSAKCKFETEHRKKLILQQCQLWKRRMYRPSEDMVISIVSEARSSARLLD